MARADRHEAPARPLRCLGATRSGAWSLAESRARVQVMLA